MVNGKLNCSHKYISTLILHVFKFRHLYNLKNKLSKNNKIKTAIRYLEYSCYIISTNFVVAVANNRAIVREIQGLKYT